MWQLVCHIFFVNFSFFATKKEAEASFKTSGDADF